MRPIDSSELKRRRGRGAQGSGYQIDSARPSVALVLSPLLRQPSAHKAASGLACDAAGQAQMTAKARLAEAVGLARAISLDVIESGLVPISRIRPSTFFGSGKVEELQALIRAGNIELVIVDHSLSPVQQRNLERVWGAKVIDRTGLILEIFGRRARTREGRLQVELAHLTYQKSRLVRSWTHLERQRGGFGFLGGPGETQIEADRRLIQGRIEAIGKDLETVKRTRKLHRASRERVPYPIVALVGYTNAGKSTLFNRLTGADVRAENLLFATLDPTMREVVLPSGVRIILADTVGFISDLPTMLIAAFRATLEEVVEADLIIHIRDIAIEESIAQRDSVQSVLREMGIDPHDAETNILEVWNKSDCLDPDILEKTLNAAQRHKDQAILISAATGQGLDTLLSAIDNRLNEGFSLLEIHIDPNEGRLLSWLYENSKVLKKVCHDDGSQTCTVRIPALMRRHLNTQLIKRLT